MGVLGSAGFEFFEIAVRVIECGSSPNGAHGAACGVLVGIICSIFLLCYTVPMATSVGKR